MKKLLSVLLCVAMLAGLLVGNGLLTLAETNELLTIASSDPGTTNQWFYNPSYANTEANYVVVAENGYLDIGSLKWVNDYDNRTHDITVQIYPEGLVAGETYTLTLYLKGTTGSHSEEQHLFAYEYSTSNMLYFFTTGQTTYGTADGGWTKVTHTFTCTNPAKYWRFRMSAYAADSEIYMDNITMTDASGVDHLGGAGSLCTIPSEDNGADTGSGGTDDGDDTTTEESVDLPTIAYDYPGYNQWYETPSYPYTDGHSYCEIVEDGYLDEGSMMFYSDSTVTSDLHVLIHPKGLVAGETYTLTVYLKGTLGYSSETDALFVYEYGQHRVDNISDLPRLTTAGQKTYGADGAWEKVSLDFTIVDPTQPFRFQLGYYTWASTLYMDNVTLTNKRGVDMLEGAGNFRLTREPTDIAANAETAGDYEWYYALNGAGQLTANTDAGSMTIAETGATDVGSLHIVNGEPASGRQDMWLGIDVPEMPAGDYTVNMKVKGTVGYHNQPFRFVENVSDCINNNDYNITQVTTSFADWTDFSYTYTSTGVNSFRLLFSIYNWVSDIYIDDLEVISADTGKDMLNGAGHFSGPKLYKLYDTVDDTTGRYQWFWTPNGAARIPEKNDNYYIEIARPGATTDGSLHIVNCEGADSDDMWLGLITDEIPAGDYTVRLKVKGSVTSGGQGFRFVDFTHIDDGSYDVSRTTTSWSEWTEYTFDLTSTGENNFRFVFGRYNNVSNVYVDDIEFISKETGEDMLMGAGHFSYADTVTNLPQTMPLLDFSYVAEDALGTTAGVLETDSSAPTLALTTEDTEIGKGMKATWSYDGVKPSYLHSYSNTGEDGWSTAFATYADNYDYFRLWISNPSHVNLHLTVKLTADGTVNYLNAASAKLIGQSGTQEHGEAGNEAGLGDGCSISIPKQFEGWVSFPLDYENLLVADGYTDTITSYAACTDVQLDLRKQASSGESDTASFYYVLDEVSLSQTITGELHSTEDKDYIDYDTTVKGDAEIQNVIFMIGDGMGYGALDNARLIRPILWMDTIVDNGGVTGTVCTNNVYDTLTDSAAAGTALATGVKTANTVVGLTADDEPIMNLSEWFKQLGKKVGLITTGYMADATPAVFAAHTTDRNNHTAIIKEMYELGIDALFGGGAFEFDVSTTNSVGATVSLKNLGINEFGYQAISTKTELANLGEDAEKVLGLFWTYMVYVSTNEFDATTQPSIAEMSTGMFDLLENDDGFFTMIEGSRIDHANHANLVAEAQGEVLAFDDAVKVAMDYVDANPGTLLVVTADHDTGGTRVEDGEVTFTSISHTDEPVAYFAYGTGSEYFRNLTDNTQINHAIRMAAMGSTESYAVSVPTTDELTATDGITTTVTDGVITYTAQETLGSVGLTTDSAKYAVLKYKSSTGGLVGTIDDSLIHYANDGKWHVSDVLMLNEGTAHTFQPMSYVVGTNYNTIEIAGTAVEIAYVAFFDTYEAAAAFQATALLNGTLPTVKPADDPLFAGATLTLGDDLDLNFKLNIPDEDFTSGMKVTFTLDGKTMPEAVLGEKDADGYYTATVEVPAKDMTAPIVATLVSADGATTYGTLTYTVKQYGEQIIAGDYAEKYKTAATAMLNYGGYAQLYFGVRTDALANADISNDLSAADVSGVTGLQIENGLASYRGSSLVLRSKTAVRLYFSEPVTGSTIAGNGLYYVEVSGLSAPQLSATQTVTVDGATYTFSVLSLAKSVIEGDYDADFRNLMKALVLYADAVAGL